MTIGDLAGVQVAWGVGWAEPWGRKDLARRVLRPLPRHHVCLLTPCRGMTAEEAQETGFLKGLSAQRNAWEILVEHNLSFGKLWQEKNKCG